MAKLLRRDFMTGLRWRWPGPFWANIWCGAGRRAGLGASPRPRATSDGWTRPAMPTATSAPRGPRPSMPRRHGVHLPHLRHVPLPQLRRGARGRAPARCSSGRWRPGITASASPATGWVGMAEMSPIRGELSQRPGKALQGHVPHQKGKRPGSDRRGALVERPHRPGLPCRRRSALFHPDGQAIGTSRAADFPEGFESLLLFDLDGTLIDPTGSGSRWTWPFWSRHGLTPTRVQRRRPPIFPTAAQFTRDFQLHGQPGGHHGRVAAMARGRLRRRDPLKPVLQGVFSWSRNFQKGNPLPSSPPACPISAGRCWPPRPDGTFFREIASPMTSAWRSGTPEFFDGVIARLA